MPGNFTDYIWQAYRYLRKKRRRTAVPRDEFSILNNNLRCPGTNTWASSREAQYQGPCERHIYVYTYIYVYTHTHAQYIWKNTHVYKEYTHTHTHIKSKEKLLWIIWFKALLSSQVTDETSLRKEKQKERKKENQGTKTQSSGAAPVRRDASQESGFPSVPFPSTYLSIPSPRRFRVTGTRKESVSRVFLFDLNRPYVTPEPDAPNRYEQEGLKKNWQSTSRRSMIHSPVLGSF